MFLYNKRVEGGVKVKMHAANSSRYLHTCFWASNLSPTRHTSVAPKFFQLEASTWKEITFVCDCVFFPKHRTFTDDGSAAAGASTFLFPTSLWHTPLPFKIHKLLSALTFAYYPLQFQAPACNTFLYIPCYHHPYSTYHCSKILCFPNHKRFVTESLSRTSRWSYVSLKVLAIFLNSWPHGLLESCWEMLFSKG